MLDLCIVLPQEGCVMLRQHKAVSQMPLVEDAFNVTRDDLNVKCKWSIQQYDDVIMCDIWECNDVKM